MKTKFPRSLAVEVAQSIMAMLYPYCDKIAVAGSLRRGKQEVGDVEILYIPQLVIAQGDLFGRDAKESATKLVLERMIGEGIIKKRTNCENAEMWGAQNKLAIHVETGIPVDLFSTTHPAWWNYLTCRTGGAESNKRIAIAAQRKGWTWRPYGPGFSRGDEINEQWHIVASEEDVFKFVGMPYLPPEERP